MEEINKIYQQKCSKKSDINEHLPTIKTYCEKCEHITEMGTRDVVSTWAMLASKPSKMISYDIVRSNNIEHTINLSKKYNIDFTFKIADTLNLTIEKTDLLLIDTLHTYDQLIQELNLHSDNVNKYIVLHDTVSFGTKDEKIYKHASNLIKNKTKTKQGLKTAVNDFLSNNDNWVLEKEFKNNNGLTIIKRK